MKGLDDAKIAVLQSTVQTLQSDVGKVFLHIAQWLRLKKNGADHIRKALSLLSEYFGTFSNIEGENYTDKPEIVSSDQGVQFTSNEFTGKLQSAGIRISMDGRGRLFDNIFVERLWRTIKYEGYIHNYQSIRDARNSLQNIMVFYCRF
ncbi:hypothetical protein [Candidatus Magnetominusculus xianensis]|uniref:hypothetical protein n=1 Tax=Candidatus Magnetominusculus xianensis TaxID=1748249 RepID=UPI0019EDF984|nr:DDE-type integrase/transposase/recombinase [Nitrospirota bacterium]